MGKAATNIKLPTPALGSIYDLAKEAGVSASTVSRVLNQRGRIGGETRKKVLAAARAAGFRPKMTARNTTVALVLDRQRFASYGGFISVLINNLVQAVSRHEVAVELFTEQNLNRLKDRFVDGILAMAWDDATIDLLQNVQDVPVVALNRMDVSAFSAVATDHYHDGVAAVDYLADRGHTRIALICEEENNWGSMERIRGFTTRLSERGLEASDSLIAATEHQPMYGQLRRLLSLKPTAIFVAGEDLGLEAMYILRDMMGVKVPQELSLIGMESGSVMRFLSPPLTAFCQPLEELANEALDLLLAHIADGNPTPVRKLLKNRLIERESVRVIETDTSVTLPVTTR